MDCKELTEKLKTDLIWRLELSRIAVESGLQETDKIYLIYLTETEAIFGVRHTGSNLNHLRQSLGILITQQTSVVYSLEKIKVFDRAVDEVEYVMNHSDLSAYIQSHGGSCEVLAVNEETGVITISLVGTCSTCSSSIITMKMGVEKFLEETLPWVKKVETPDQPQDPDFGITKVLEEVEKETGNGSSMISEGAPSADLETNSSTSPKQGGESNDK